MTLFSFLSSWRLQRRNAAENCFNKSTRQRVSATRSIRVQALESRRLLVAESETFTLNQSFEAAGLVGTPRATVQWGDGTQSAATITGGTPTGTVRFRFDYSLDTSGFFNDPARRNLLQLAGQTLTSRLSDSLSAINPSGINTWSARTFHPSTGNVTSINNLQVAANEIVVYAGARDLPAAQVGEGGPGGFSFSGTPDWGNTVRARGQTGALASPRTDYGPWGGSISFDNRTNWYFGLDEDGLQRDQQDFLTVASHELMHLLGFGASNNEAWTRFVSGNTFTGPASRAAYDPGGNVPLADAGHWLESVNDAGRKALMGPTVPIGSRETLTALDLAGLDDIGWNVGTTRGTVTAQHIYADNGNYPVSIVYSGATGGEFIQQLTATITNVNPTLAVVANQTAVASQTLRLTNIGTITDPGYANNSATPPTAETFTYTINWGDGTAIDSGAATIDRVGNANVETLASFDGSHAYRNSGTYNVSVAVRDDDGGTSQRSFQIIVASPPELALELNRTTVLENAGAAAATLTVRRTGSTAAATSINLTSSDATEITVPPSVVIPVGQSSITVPVAAVDDNLLDGTQTVTLSAAASGFVTDTIAISVTDAESLSAVLSSPTVREDAATGSFVLTVTRSNTDTLLPLVVSLSGNVPSEITAPGTITIPAGSRQAQVAVRPINDDDPEATLALTYRLSASGYSTTDIAFLLLDDEQPLFQNSDNRFDVDDNGQVTALDALRIINFISRRRSGNVLNPETEQPDGLFVDVNGDYQTTPLDALLIINELSRLARLRSMTVGDQQAATAAALYASPPASVKESVSNRLVPENVDRAMLF